VRHLFRKEVVIVDPDYDRIVTDLSQLNIDCKAYIDKCRLMKSPNYIKLWMVNAHDEEIVKLNDRLETLVEEMSNSQSITLLNALNNYPVIAVHAHVHPFDTYWLNMLAGLLVPVGLFYYFRIWAFRVRLGKDINRIIKTNEEITTIIQTNL
jgi:lipopolysaccharide export system permease protein